MSEQQDPVPSQVVLPPAGPERYGKSRLFILLAGVILPIFTLGFEASTHVSGEAFFDPIPTLAHLFLLSLVPLANAWLLFELGRRVPRLPPGLGACNAFAIGIAAFHALLYLPLTPFAPFMVIFYGFGFLPLTPLLALLAAWRGRALLKRRLVEQGGAGPTRFWRGIGLAMLALVVVNLLASLTHIGLQMARHSAPDDRQFGVRWLRAVGDEKLLRQACYSRSGRAIDPLGLLFNFGDTVTPDEARRVYYLVTGQAFNHLPEPVARGWRQRWWDGDLDLGGKNVGRRVDGVSLSHSRLDGSIDADAALGYLEWTMVFRNDSSQQQEGRAQIALPPGAVVSRLTLWIDGEEREAAFGTRNQTRQAYQSVVQARRDPVLVTTAGKDRVMLQLFPIPPRGGEMKVRLGITTPLQLATPALARLQLPALRERNFEIGKALTHAVWLEAEKRLTASGIWRQEQIGEQAYALRGELADEQLGSAASLIDLPRDAQLRTTWSPDVAAGPGGVVVQRLQEHAVSVPRRLALVIDGSQALAPLAGDIAGALDKLPAGIELAVFVASDSGESLAGSNSPAVAAKQLRRMDFVGGQDNIDALGKAWDWAAETPDSALLWIHGPQPVVLGSVEPLLQRNQRAPGQVRFFPLEAVAGPNEVLEALDGFAGMAPVRRAAKLQTDLESLFAGWQPGSTEIRALRAEQAFSALAGEPAVKTSDHLVRLWAADRIERLLLKSDEPSRQAATALALKYHLVTPVSGAVVLETAVQYDAAGLKPVDKGSVPTVPEPEEWMLMFVVGLLLFWMLRRHRASRPALA
ncbi:MAG: hypothetical protein H6R15_1983 [Proteobacteria bacterium]|nr:hypothetical protein [Pseudomonadota bacterium]